MAWVTLTTFYLVLLAGAVALVSLCAACNLASSGNPFGVRRTPNPRRSGARQSESATQQEPHSICARCARAYTPRPYFDPGKAMFCELCATSRRRRTWLAQNTAGTRLITGYFLHAVRDQGIAYATLIDIRGQPHRVRRTDLSSSDIAYIEDRLSTPARKAWRDTPTPIDSQTNQGRSSSGGKPESGAETTGKTRGSQQATEPRATPFDGSSREQQLAADRSEEALVEKLFAATGDLPRYRRRLWLSYRGEPVSVGYSRLLKTKIGHSDEVVLEGQDGLAFTVPFVNLSPQDMRYVRQVYLRFMTARSQAEARKAWSDVHGEPGRGTEPNSQARGQRTDGARASESTPDRKTPPQHSRSRTPAYEAYTALGLEDGIPLEEAEQHYRRLSLQHHPDRHRNAPASEQSHHESVMKKINNAIAGVRSLWGRWRS
jgi:hypothetical protein